MSTPSITEKFSTRLKQTLVIAEDAAEDFRHEVVDTDHLLFALRIYKGSVASEVLKSARLKVETMRPIIAKNHTVRSGQASKLKYTGQARRALVRATWTASQNKHHFVGTEHLLAALLAQRDGRARQLLNQLSVDLKQMRHQLRLVLRGTSHFPDITETLRLHVVPSGITTKKQTPLLDEFGIDLNQRAREKRTDPIIGRSEELARLTDVLERRTKNNAVLVGQPGVGKTAIVEGLAHKIVSGHVPAMLINKRIVQIDLTGMLAGTAYRGDFEERMQQLLKETEKVGNAILFIDELHTLVGTGNVGGSLDAANMLKNALARGDIKMIGATTPTEYKKYIESDPALQRRFQVVDVNEVTQDQAEQILVGLKPLYEKFHGITITQDAIGAAVNLSSRYLPEKFLPDKAIDLIDESMSRKKVDQARGRAANSGKLERDRLGILALETEQMILDERYGDALKNQRRMARLRLKAKQPRKTKKAVVLREDIAEVVARSTGIPIDQILSNNAAKFLNLTKKLERKIVGQRHALRAVSNTLLRSGAGLQDPDRPLGVFLFLGPSGVGKTELAKNLAEIVYQNPDSLVRLDMSEFSERFTASGLLGSPPGYVGFGEGGRLTEAVRKQPYSVVLFDEIEKAHSDVMQILLQIFEDGHATDAAGLKVNFKNTICIMTSNLGNKYSGQGEIIGFDSVKSSDAATNKLDLKKTLQDHFRPELLSRIDQVVAFHAISDQDLKKIFAIEFAKLRKRLADNHVELKITDAVIENAIKERNLDTGARFIRNFIQEHIEPQIAKQMVAQKKPTCLMIDWKSNTTAVTPV